MIRMKRRQLDKIRGARISYVPQGSGNGLNPLLTVGFQVAEPMIEHQKIGKKEAIAEAVKLMKRFTSVTRKRWLLSIPSPTAAA